VTRRPACALSGSAVRGLCVAERLVGGVGEVGYRVELEVVGPLLSGFGSGSPAGAVVTAVDPDRRQAFPLDRDWSWNRLCATCSRSVRACPRSVSVGEGTEVILGGLVGADVLGGNDGGEKIAQPSVAAGEAVPVHVGEDDQLVVLGSRARASAESGNAGQSGTELPGRCAHSPVTGRWSLSPVRRKTAARTSG
jgi:hypothetical protein